MLVGALALAGALALPSVACAQDTTFSVDRLHIGGAPDDGVAVYRPEMGEKTRFFGQFDVGYSYNPFRIEHELQDRLQAARMATLSGAPVRQQLTGYFDIGVELFGRLSVQVMLPVTFIQTGNPTAANGVADANTNVNLKPIALGDTRVELRGVIYRTKDHFFKLGANTFLTAPSGNEDSWTGDNGVAGGLGVAAELDFKKAFITLNTGFNFRPKGIVDDFHVGHEWTWGLGGFLPLRDGAIRLGAEIFGSTGIQDLTGLGPAQGANTVFHVQNTPLEWMVEARFAVGEKKRFYFGGNGGTRLTPGYAPDFRLGALIGYWFTIDDPGPKEDDKVKARSFDSTLDTDHDGIPDVQDLCPTEPGPASNDGCPVRQDRDGDGIPDAEDACPDQPGPRNRLNPKMNGCPNNDIDGDGIPDAQDACPKEPGPKSDDPKKNGCPQFIRRISGSNEIQVLKQVQFEFGSARIKKDSFPILDEVYSLLIANPEITLMSIEGHTDNVGSEGLNLQLSKDRAHSCLDYLKNKGIAAARLTSDGFGKTKPIDTNDTDAGRQNNRRVEFHIKSQTGGVTVQEQGPHGGPVPGSDGPTESKSGPAPSSSPPPKGAPVPGAD